MLRLGVSRNTIREALRALVHLGMLEARPGDGTFVLAPSELGLPFVRRARRAPLAEAVEIRALFERQSARIAAARRRNTDLDKLRRLVRRLHAASETSDRATYAAADAELHRAVVACTGNALLIEIYEHLGGALKLAVSPELWDRALAAEQVALHTALIEAIAARDGAAAERAAAALMEALAKALLRPEDR